jgi:hypothetical protein
MAKNSKEILEDFILSGGYDTPYEELGKFGGLTDEQAERAFLAKHGNFAPLQTRVEELEGTAMPVPTIETILAKLNLPSIKNGGVEKFVKEFPQKQGKWKKEILKDDAYGEKGWNTVRDMFRKATHDYYMGEAAMQKAREDAVNNAGYVLPIVGDIGDVPFTTTLAKIMHPRVVERITNGADIRAKDVLLDQGENLAMSVPGTGWTGMAYKGIGKIAPKVARGLSDLGKWSSSTGMLKKSAGNAANIIKTAMGNAVVPSVSEAADAALYGDNEGMDERSRFSVGDALTGAAVNQVVNRGLFRQGAPMLMNLSGSLDGGAGSGTMRDFLSKIGTDFSAPGKRFADDVFEKAAIKDVVEKGLLSGGEVRAAGLGNMGFKNSITKSESDAAKATADILNAIKLGVVSPEDVRLIATQGNAAGMNDKLTKEVLAHPREFVNYANWNGKDAASVLDRALNAANVSGTAFGVNKAGKEEFTRQLFNQFPGIGEAIKEEREEKRDAPKVERAKADASDASRTPGLTERDKKHLKEIANNPALITSGEGSEDFKLWMLERGYDLLRGTAAGRDIWGIK